MCVSGFVLRELFLKIDCKTSIDSVKVIYVLM